MSPRINNKRKIPKSVWLPTLLVCYLIAMTAWYAPRLIAGGETTRLVVVFLVECAIIITLYFFLRHREKQER